MSTEYNMEGREKEEDKVIRRTLELYTRLLKGKAVNKREFAEHNCVGAVSNRTVQRYLAAIQAFLSDQRCQKGIEQSILYDRKVGGHCLVDMDSIRLSAGEMLAVCKVLIDSRAFSKSGLKSLVLRILKHCMRQEDVDKKCA